jgi:hypothetical protein
MAGPVPAIYVFTAAAKLKNIAAVMPRFKRGIQ